MSTSPPPGYGPDQPPQGDPNQGYPQQGYPNQGYPNQGDPPAGYPSPNYPGYPASGYSYPAPGGPAASPDDPLVPADFGGWFQRVVGVVKRSFPQLAILQAISALVSAVFGVVGFVAMPDMSGYAAGTADPSQIGATIGPIIGLSILGGLIALVVGAYVQGGSVFVAIRDAAGQTTGAADGLRFATGRVLALIGWGLLAGLIVGVGFVLLIIPGIYLGVVIFSSLYGVIVVERQGLGRCFQLIKGRFWPTFGRLLVAGLIGGVYFGIVQAITGGGFGTPPTSAVTPILQAVLMIPLGVAATGVVVVTYAELRQHEGGTSTPALAAEMGQ